MCGVALSVQNVDRNMRFQLVMMTAGRWMGFQLNFSAACIVFIVALSITTSDFTAIDAGTTGLALTYGPAFARPPTAFSLPLLDSHCLLTAFP